jgi:hypothetical protein
MKTIKHSLHFVTELDETNPTAKKLLDLPADEQIMLLEGMLKELVAPKLSKTIKELNEGNSFATLRLA